MLVISCRGSNVNNCSNLNNIPPIELLQIIYSLHAFMSAADFFKINFLKNSFRGKDMVKKPYLTLLLYLPALLYLPRTTPFYASVSKGAVSAIFHTFGIGWPSLEPITSRSESAN